jgi:hypothetical protein
VARFNPGATRFGLIFVIHTALDFGVGFLSAAAFGLLLIPLIYRRGARRTMDSIVAARPYSTVEIHADKDELRAKLAASTRSLEMRVVEMRTKTTSKLAEFEQKTDVINRLKEELGEKAATIFALQDRNKALRKKMRATEVQLEIRGGALRKAEELLAGKEAELSKLVAELGEHSAIADRQRKEIAALHVQVEAIKATVAGYEDSLKETALRLSREAGGAPWRDMAEARNEPFDFRTRRARRY